MILRDKGPLKLQKEKSNWDPIPETTEKHSPIVLGKYVSYWYHRTPRRMLHSLSYYKFATKMIGKEKRVLDIGCNEGLGTWLLAKECGFAKGVDFDEEAIEAARRNFHSSFTDFSCEDILTSTSHPWDAVVNFDTIEHIHPENVSSFFSAILRNLSSTGIAIIGTPSLISQQFASEISKKGHVNIYSHERLRKEMEEHFSFVFLFAANDEVVHTGYLPLAHYFIAVGCKKK